MRSSWEKIQEIQRNLSKDGRISVYWVVSVRLYFPLNQPDTVTRGKGTVNRSLGSVPVTA